MPRSLRYRAAQISLMALLSLAAAAPGLAADPTEPGPAADLMRRAHELVRAEKTEQANDLFREVLRIDPDHAVARARLGFVKKDGRWTARPETKSNIAATGLLTKYADSNRAARSAIRKRVRALPARSRAAVLRTALSHDHASVRRLAVNEIAHGKHTELAEALVDVGLDDASKTVRRAALAAVTKLPDVDEIALLAHAATGGAETKSTRRVRAIDALGASGDPAAVRYLVAVHEVRGGGAPRVMFSDLSQLTFIQDFDVEVASTAFIADPIVAPIQDGRVTDVQVVATGGKSIRIEREAAHRALRELTGVTSVKDAKGAWLAWWKTREKATASNE